MRPFELRDNEASRLENWLKQALHEVPPFSFSYGGESSKKLLPEWDRQETVVYDQRGTKIYSVAFTAPDGLAIVLEMKIYAGFSAADWVLRIRNDGARESRLLTEVLSCDTLLPFGPEPGPRPGMFPGDGVTTLFSSLGSMLSSEDFMPSYSRMAMQAPISFSPVGGRSSSHTMPFFNVLQEEEGVICAVGWTGQWKAAFTRVEEGVCVRAGLELTRFKLYPGEEIRTPSMLLLFWEGGQLRGHNLLRRLLLADFVPRGADGQPIELPLVNGSWGGMRTEKHIERIRMIKEHQLPYDIYWMDAGWYGTPESYSPSEFEGDWWTQVGNWDVNPKAHPNGLEPVAEAARANGMQFLLWFEPERALPNNYMPMTHPDWYLRVSGAGGAHAGERLRIVGDIYMHMRDHTAESHNQALLLNIGEPEPLDWLIGLISERIASLGLRCYRQDFNIDPLPYWRQADAPDRQGITETKYIMGLYKFWDTLLERFPGLLIDNCASGGRRLDIETARRSAPLWRSDYQCFWNCDPIGAQSHTAALSWWLPLSATSGGLTPGDTYKVRSSYSAGLGIGYWVYEHSRVDDDHPWEWHRSIMEEFKRARPFFYGDYYPLTDYSVDNHAWMAWQFDRPELKSGIIQVFRRPGSPCVLGQFSLEGLEAGASYEFEDADTGVLTTYTAEALSSDGFAVTIPNKRESRLYFYRKI